MQNLTERLRPLVGLKGRDYCVICKLSEDQSLSWRDTMQHSRTNSCDLLAQLPSLVRSFLYGSFSCPPLHLDAYHRMRSFFNVHLIIDFLKVLDVCFSHIVPYNTNKLSFKSIKCVFIRYNNHYKG
ncbi:hypothetical protein PRUPE_6G200700 [Prunus persica]|uniref:Retroviral polymerase SH3-like domain-containing protein n=1 Tax=Prunus persica TaxID=3760 RepID=A0A251NT51_PRUPE|nr:hypothetical protein PRUPE_6G200700 [Prunus persica]